jgi:hypothetical protein
MPVLLTGILIYGLSLPSCKTGNNQKDALKYFDIAGYFKKDTAKLNHQNIVITKTVGHNGQSETQKVHIKNWGNEFNLFIISDINKPAWRESYDVKNESDLVIYTAKDPSLKTRKIIIKKDGEKVKWILINNYTTNFLYTTAEKLSYFPDSLYQIEKSQQVKLMGMNRYLIKGLFH